MSAQVFRTDQPEELFERYFDSQHKGWCLPGWSILHAMADAFPAEPTDEQRASMLLMLQHFARNLPCQVCSGHMCDDMRAHPVDVSSGPALSDWMRRFHNRVRVRLGMTEFSPAAAMEAQQFIRSVKWSQVLADLQAALGPQFAAALPPSSSPRRAAATLPAGANGSHLAGALAGAAPPASEHSMFFKSRTAAAGPPLACAAAPEPCPRVAGASSPATPSSSSSPSEAPSRPRRNRLVPLAVAVVVVLLALGGLCFYECQRNRRAALSPSAASADAFAAPPRRYDSQPASDGIWGPLLSPSSCSLGS